METCRYSSYGRREHLPIVTANQSLDKGLLFKTHSLLRLSLSLRNATYPVGDKAKSDEATMSLIRTAR